MKSRQTLSILILGSLSLSLVGCDRKNNPLFGNVSSGVSAVSIAIPQIDTTSGENNRIFVSVLDQLAAPLGGFQLGNFNILEGGSPGVPYNVGPVQETLYVVMVIDRSGSMSGSRTTAANNAAVALVNAMSTSDFAAIMEFESSVRLAQGFTNDKATLISVINAGVANGATALYDGVVEGATLLQSVAGRRMLLVLTDGDDNSSINSIESAVNEVNQRGLSAYMVGLGAGVSSSTLDTIAQGTGGSSFTSLTGADLSTIFLSILNRFNNLYFIQYHRRANGTIKVILTYGSLTTTAEKSLD